MTSDLELKVVVSLRRLIIQRSSGYMELRFTQQVQKSTYQVH